MQLEEAIKGLREQITIQGEAMARLLQREDAQRIKDLEEKIKGMVDRSEYATLQNKYEELQASSVPKQDFVALQNQFSNFDPRQIFEEMQTTLAKKSVPREQLIATEAKLQELEAKIANSIPRPEHDELVAKIMSLIGEAPSSSSGLDALSETVATPVPELIATTTL